MYRKLRFVQEIQICMIVRQFLYSKIILISCTNLGPAVTPHCLKFRIIIAIYRNDPKFSDRYAWANSADPDQTGPLGAV